MEATVRVSHPPASDRNGGCPPAHISGSWKPPVSNEIVSGKEYEDEEYEYDMFSSKRLSLGSDPINRLLRSIEEDIEVEKSKEFWRRLWDSIDSKEEKE